MRRNQEIKRLLKDTSAISYKANDSDKKLLNDSHECMQLSKIKRWGTVKASTYIHSVVTVIICYSNANDNK